MKFKKKKKIKRWTFCLLKDRKRKKIFKTLIKNFIRFWPQINKISSEFFDS